MLPLEKTGKFDKGINFPVVQTSMQLNSCMKYKKFWSPRCTLLSRINKLYIDAAYVAVGCLNECFHPLVMEFLSQFENISTFEKRKKSIGI